MDISLPEQGIRLSFKKLGGNPTMSLAYRKKGLLSSLLYLLLLVAGIVGSVKVRKWRFPEEEIIGFFKRKTISDFCYRCLKSRALKALPTLLMICAFFIGLPWFIMGLGLNTILFLRYFSTKWYEIKGDVPSYNLRIFLKYFLSYVILVSSLLFIITLFHPIFFVSMAAATFSNAIQVVIYALFYLYAKRKPKQEREALNESKSESTKPEEKHKNDYPDGGNSFPSV